MTHQRRRLTVEAEPAFRTRRANPYNARLYERVASRGVEVRDLSWGRLLTRRVDVVHLHWPSLTFLSGHRRSLVAARLVLFSACLAVARLRGTRLVWTAHNIGAHERRSTPMLRRWHRRMLMRNLDGVIALTESGADDVRRGYPELARVPVAVVPHGHYRDEYDFRPTRSEARELLGLAEDALVVATVGQIRAYKGVPQLVTLFRDTAGADAVLLVAGRPASPALDAQIARAAAGDERIRYEPGFLDDRALALRLLAADLVVLNYDSVQNSGSAVLALSAGRPVLAPAIGALPELRDAIGGEWVRLFTGPLTGAVLAAELARAQQAPVGPPDLGSLDWDRIAERTIAFYEAVGATARVPGSARRTGSHESAVDL